MKSRKDEILALIKNGGSLSGADVARVLSLSRQAVHRRLKELVLQGLLVKEGETKGAVYRLASGREQMKRRFRITCQLEGQEEDIVYRQAAMELGFSRRLNKRAQKIMAYAFTEMLNNAVDHSGAASCTVNVFVGSFDCSFRIRDMGIGVFDSIRGKFSLRDEFEAALELMKGKRTTAPERHTGEGIFFTSKAADAMTLRSHGITLTFDREKGDVFLEKSRFIKGTEVVFSISRHTKQDLAWVFNEYAPEEYDYQFKKTKVFVRLLKTDYLSRSEAKRILMGLESFSEIIIDLKGVGAIGQGFADEIFRVYKNMRPDVLISFENANEVVAALIRHVVDK